MTFLLQILIGIFILGILVLIHELGHFTVAKLSGIRVLSFSIGFGNILYKKTIGETEYRISAIPFGGYVHMAGEHPEDGHEGSDDEFTQKPVLIRAAVALAGPAANVIISVALLWIIFMIGMEEQVTLEKPVIGSIDKESPAAIAGFQTGDSILTMNGSSISSWDKIRYHFTLQEKKYTISYMRDGVIEEKELTMAFDEEEGIPLYIFGGLNPVFPPVIGSVAPGSQARKIGLQPKDRIVTINGEKIHTWSQIPQIVSSFDSTAGPLQLAIVRDGEPLAVEGTPAYNSKYKKFILGIMPSTQKKRYGPVAAIPRALDKSWEYTTMIFRILPRVFSMRKQLAGPVGIMHMSGQMALISIVGLLNLMALIGINLGVLNLFPLIITDGGVLFFLLIESFRKKPLSLKTQLLLNRIAIGFFITLFLFVTFNDIERILRLFNIFGR